MHFECEFSPFVIQTSLTWSHPLSGILPMPYWVQTLTALFRFKFCVLFSTFTTVESISSSNICLFDRLSDQSVTDPRKRPCCHIRMQFPCFHHFDNEIKTVTTCLTAEYIFFFIQLTFSYKGKVTKLCYIVSPSCRVHAFFSMFPSIWQQ